MVDVCDGCMQNIRTVESPNETLWKYGMVWYGMVWYGMVWYGMVWYDMVWYGMVWYGRGTEGTRGGREGGRQGLVRMQVGTKECKCFDYTNGPKFGFEQLTR